MFYQNRAHSGMASLSRARDITRTREQERGGVTVKTSPYQPVMVNALMTSFQRRRDSYGRLAVEKRHRGTASLKFRSHIVKWFNVPRSSLRDSTQRVALMASTGCCGAIITISAAPGFQLCTVNPKLAVLLSFVLISPTVRTAPISGYFSCAIR